MLIYRIEVKTYFLFKGMEITVHNLIKKSARVYKSNSAINFTSLQTFDLYNQKPEADALTTTESKTLKNPNSPSYLYECLLETTSQIFNILYAKNSNLTKVSDSTQSSDTNRSSLLFSDENSSITGLANGSEHKFLAQIIKVYDLNLKLKCTVCANLLNSCACRPRNETLFRVEINISFLIDDHTSILKLNYSSANYVYTQASNQSNLFKPIAGYLTSILKGYLNEINLPTVPLPNNVSSFSDASDSSTRLYQAFREKTSTSRLAPNANNTSSNNSIDSSLFGSSGESHFFESNVKLDIYKTLYDYVLYTVLNKYFMFYVDMNDASNAKEICKQRAPLASNSNFKTKSELGFFKLSELEQNEQFKSMLGLTCVRFVPIEIEFGS